jgi:hypothetical protein
MSKQPRGDRMKEDYHTPSKCPKHGILFVDHGFLFSSAGAQGTFLFPYAPYQD